MNKRKKEASRKAAVVLLALAGILLALVVGSCALLFTRYLWVGGGFRQRGDDLLDLRGERISLSDYEKVAQAFPGREILWDIPLQSGPVSCDASRVAVSSLSEEDWQALELMPNLTLLDAAGCRDYDRLLDFQARHPQCQVRYTVTLDGQEYPSDAQSITVSRLDLSALAEAMSYLPQLSQVEFTGSAPSDAELDQLTAAFPQVFIHCFLPLGGTTVDSAATELDLHGRAVTAEEVTRLVSRMPNLTRVNLLGCPLEDSQVLQLAEAFPGCLFLWELRLGDQVFRTDAEELDLSGWRVSGTQAVERYLPCFPNLKRVIMCNCGLDDETMDALNRKYEDIRFIWSVRIQDVEIRTDTKWFYPYKYRKDMVVVEEDLYPLRYCTDIEAIDIGHMTQVKTCDWVSYMPNLKYLIIIETAITDISPLSNLKNLVFLEIFTTKITDYSPLLGCTALEDLNLGNTYGNPAPILQMTWLKNLWWGGIEGSVGLICSDAPQRLREALPDTNMKFNMETPNVNNGWRQLDNYYAMRDLMDVFYLT